MPEAARVVAEELAVAAEGTKTMLEAERAVDSYICRKGFDRSKGDGCGWTNRGDPSWRMSKIQGKTVDVHLWAPVHEVESQALDQLRMIASLPWVFSHVAAMPDVHLGKGATVGSVIAMKGALAPSAVGVDIGCGDVCGTDESDRIRSAGLDLKAIRHADRARHPARQLLRLR
jgi:hypothetical protein